jgi:hypothetical protein
MDTTAKRPLRDLPLAELVRRVHTEVALLGAICRRLVPLLRDAELPDGYPVAEALDWHLRVEDLTAVLAYTEDVAAAVRRRPLAGFDRTLALSTHRRLKWQQTYWAGLEHLLRAAVPEHQGE